MSGASIRGKPPGPEEVERVLLEEGQRAMREATELVRDEWARTSGRRISASEPTVSGNHVEGHVGSRDFVVRLLEKGRGVVRPKRRGRRTKKALAINVGGTVIFRKRAGPVRARRYGKRAVEATKPQVHDAFVDGARRAARRLSGGRR